jgi:hypothetical protein
MWSLAQVATASLKKICSENPSHYEAKRLQYSRPADLLSNLKGKIVLSAIDDGSILLHAGS